MCISWLTVILQLLSAQAFSSYYYVSAFMVPALKLSNDWKADCRSLAFDAYYPTGTFSFFCTFVLAVKLIDATISAVACYTKKANGLAARLADRLVLYAARNCPKDYHCGATQNIALNARHSAQLASLVVWTKMPRFISIFGQAVILRYTHTNTRLFGSPCTM